MSFLTAAGVGRTPDLSSASSVRNFCLPASDAKFHFGGPLMILTQQIENRRDSE